MVLILARFLFGFALTWIAAAVLIATTLLAIRLIGIAVAAFADERRGDLAGAACVAALVVAALRGIYALGDVLHDAVGRSVLINSAGDWLAGAAPLSPAALFGAAAALAAMAGARAWVFHTPAEPGRAGAGSPARRDAAAGTARAVSTRKRDRKPESSLAVGRTRLATKAPPGRGPRIPQLGWTALFLLLFGAATVGLAISMTPVGPPVDAAPALLQRFQEVEQRARPLFTAGLTLLGLGTVFLLSWITLRRRAAG